MNRRPTAHGARPEQRRVVGCRKWPVSGTLNQKVECRVALRSFSQIKSTALLVVARLGIAAAWALSGSLEATVL
jgi:hypothetical protein